jgi:hypothetical protein
MMAQSNVHAQSNAQQPIPPDAGEPQKCLSHRTITSPQSGVTKKIQLTQAVTFRSGVAGAKPAKAPTASVTATSANKFERFAELFGSWDAKSGDFLIGSRFTWEPRDNRAEPGGREPRAVAGSVVVSHRLGAPHVVKPIPADDAPSRRVPVNPAARWCRRFFCRARRGEPCRH